jgi:hypothetical protein
MIDKRQIFKAPELQSLFDNNGFVKVPLLSETQADELAALFDSTKQLHDTATSPHHTTTDTQNPELIRLVDSKIKSIYIHELEKILTDFKALVACFHIKEVGPNSETGIHQDPTFVDESKYCSANVWVALHDIDENNGNLFFIRGSNRVATTLRTIPDYPSYYQDFKNSLPELAVHVPLKKGEAVIFSNATIHAATNNLSDSPRIASTLLICSQSADWSLYYKDANVPNDKIEEYHLDMETFISMSKSGRPDQKSFTKYVTAEFPQISKKEFLQKIGAEPKSKENLFQKLQGFFKTN